MGIIVLLFFPLYVYVRRPYLLLRHVETTAARAGGGACILLALVWLSFVQQSHSCFAALTLSLRWLYHHLYLVCLPFSSPPTSLLQNTYAPRADAKRFVLIMTGLSHWWACGMPCVTSSWQGLGALRLWGKAVAPAKAGCNTTRTVSSGWWTNAKRFASGVQKDKPWHYLGTWM